MSLMLAVGTALAAGIGCGGPRSETTLDAPIVVPLAFSMAGSESAPARFWEAFGDRELNAIVDRALGGNLDIRGAWARVDQAAAVAGRSRALMAPAVNLTASASDTDSEYADAAAGMAAMALGGGRKVSLGVSASYELDVWGRLRAGRAADQLSYEASEHDVRATAIAVAAQVVMTWYEISELQGQLELLESQLKTNREYAVLTETRFRQAQTMAADVLAQRQQVVASEAERPLVRLRLELAHHRLAVLLGLAPNELGTVRPEGVPRLPPLPSTGIPAALIRARPDVHSAQLRLASANKRVAQAVANRFPKLSLAASASGSDRDVSGVFDNWLSNLAANLFAPIFDAGGLKRDEERARAGARESLSGYGRVVLNALREVEDALSTERHQAEYVAGLSKQIDLARQTVERARESYLSGAADYLLVLNALKSMQRLERMELEARRRMIQNRVDLYRALGTGWALERPENPKKPAAVLDGDES
jgi:NodT family efflux transporter outer membrane factor (OMF) lipoprotein